MKSIIFQMSFFLIQAEGENTSVYHSIPESSTLKDENEFAEMTENSALESSQDEATNIQ